MQEYKTLKLNNIYNNDDINKAIPLLHSSGINTFINASDITLNFDTVNLKYLEDRKTIQNQK